MKLITVNGINETAVCEISEYKEVMYNVAEPGKPRDLEPCLKCYPLNSNEAPFFIFIDCMYYIAIDDIVIKDFTWFEYFLNTMEKDKVSFLELSKIYSETFGKSYVDIRHLKDDIENLKFDYVFSTDDCYLYKEAPEEV